MASEPLAQFMESLRDKLISETTVITDNNNIIIGETGNGLLQLNDTEDFPRIEMLIDGLSYDGFIDQRQQDQSFRYSMAGHLKRESDITTRNDMYAVVNWGREMIKSMYGLHDDRIAGNSPCDGFIQIGGFAKVKYEYELFPKTTTVIIMAEAEITLLDVYTNN